MVNIQTIRQMFPTKIVEGLRNAYLSVVRMLPLRNCLVIENSSNFDGHAWEIYRYFSESEFFSSWKLLWVVYGERVYIPEEVKRDKRVIIFCDDNRSDLYLLSRWKMQRRAKVLLNENQPIQPNSKSQLCIYLNHGFPIKSTIGNIVMGDYINYVCSPSEKYASILAKQFSCTLKKVICLGSPRVDAYYRESSELQKLGIKKEAYDKIIIWMPTFRKLQDRQYIRVDGGVVSATGLPLIHDDREYILLNELCAQKKILLIVKIHPRQYLEDIKVRSTSNVMLLFEEEMQKKHIKAYSLQRETDAMISDYSSVSLDYILLDKPLAYAVEDQSHYSLGFSTEDPHFFFAGEMLHDYNELLRFLDNVAKGQDPHATKRRELRDRFWEYQDGKSTERLMKFIQDCLK